MGATEFATSSPQAVKRWSNELAFETFGEMWFKKLIGRGPNSCVQMVPDLESMAGDEVKYDLLIQDRSDGVQGDAELEGFETELTLYQDSVKIDQLRHGHAWRKMSQQRTVHNMRTLSKQSLAKWYAWKYDTMLMAYLAGTAGGDLENAAGTIGASGFAGNALRTPDSDHAVTRAGTFTLQMIDVCVSRAKTLNPRMRPIKVDGQEKFLLILHPYAAYSLRTETGERAWQLIHARVAEGGSKNPIYTGALGEYNGVVIHESEFVPRASSATTAQNTYNLFLGAQAGVFAMGNAYDKEDSGKMEGGSYFSWNEEYKDYKNRKGVGVASTFGIQKCQFNGVDFGVLRVTSQEAQPTVS